MNRQRPLALTFPLHGSRLIEASAGTGKTFTISALYLRLILGHGGDAAFRQALLPPQILVVTFTDAATRELRDRIRARLVQAATVFRGDAQGDDLLRELRGDFAQTQWDECARRLELAAQWMDEAAVSTIHGWCQRMLREHAFDSGSLFSQTLETDHSELLAEVVRDYWRQHCYPLQGAALQWVASVWGAPVGLGARLRPLLGEDSEGATQTLGELLGSALQRREQALAELKSPWPAWADELQLLLDAAVAAKQVDGKKIQARFYNPWLEKLRDWAGSEEPRLDLGTGFTRLTPDGLAEAWKGEAPSHPALEAMALLKAQLDALPDPGEAALRHAAAWVRQRFDWEKRQRAEMGFDDMLVRLDAALQGSNGARLAEVIRLQFPVALIDEFQDTDPLQYRIFDTLYEVEANRDDCGLFMIGDPKQAIYSFRGADIHTYLRARRATSGRHYNLEKNFRSSQAMVDAVNGVFLRAEQRDGGEGAFLLRDDLPFIEVGAQGRREVWSVDGQAQPALTVWQLASDEPVAKGAYLDAMAAGAASEIVRLLDLGQRGQAGFSKEGTLTSLRPSDIAVLVRDFNEAQAIRGELAARGVRSVYLSDKDSVFAAQEARDLLLWLRACAEPDQDRPLRAALASATLGLALSELEQLNLDERTWERRVMQFRDYRQRWQRQGVLPMLRQLLQDFELPQRLMGRDDGERVLTNLLHLAELLQQAAAELDGELALIRHLGELLAGEGQAADEQVLRLESDEALVRVVTIHKSKGLEYPLVFLPFICAFRPVDDKKPLQIHDGERRQLVLKADDDSLLRAERERLGEDLRLLYVALTRARHACWLGVTDLKIGNGKKSRLHESALGYLLGGGSPLAASGELASWLAPFASALDSAVSPVPPASEQRYRMIEDGQFEPHWRTPIRRAAEHWWIASYSALRLDEDAPSQVSRHEDAAPDSPAMQNAIDDEDPLLALAPLPASAQGLHRFPRGPNPGTFLHGILEMAAQEGFATLAQDPPRLREALARRCQRRGLEGWIDPLQDWLLALLSQPLPLAGADSVVLAQLTQYQPELEFWFEARGVDVRLLDQWVQQCELPGVARQPLRADTLNGMFKGFIDLVFEHQGRYYVADYKSNWLGSDDGAYTRETMEFAIASHRYDLQYVLYVLALHRQLRLRLPDYDYDQHVGGALYLFLRAPQQGAYLARPPRELIERLDALFMGEAAEGVA
ncbi:exodeoxyribonuclease V subunit beta [Ectopseudomonas alcaliphila]|uniref:RecBCD enzyme subunit RecB n=1 Tax=Ectopseudomonas alcaliphila TaxID=101564 RepID=A0A1G7JLL3_9GAMM|nr:exodeoxyribonuclease V subunit beta [Pseudomonas alcaliphila]MDX5990511.1 exodeoxyribonuclease V subunit beta [Pseudomonas alcaliphila]SDF25783.1 DNA helicase/exodeoxyribonuclease V, beta subunit [Pseudomonas alcaliphila]